MKNYNLRVSLNAEELHLLDEHGDNVPGHEK